MSESEPQSGIGEPQGRQRKAPQPLPAMPLLLSLAE